MLAWSLSQAPEPAIAARRTADQVKTAEDSHDAGRVTPEQVKRWRMKAAQGGSQAQTNPGLLYSTGNGVLRDAREAVEWFQKGAVQGDGFGQLRLATEYFEGAGVSRDPVKGMAWATLAAELGFYRPIDGGLGLVLPNNFSITQDLTPAEAKQMEQVTTELRLKIEVRRVGAPPSTGEEGEKAPSEARGALNFGTIEFVSKPRPEPSPPFAVGIVKANGNLMPIATFDGVDWSDINLWEERESGRSVNSMLKSMEEWTLWHEDPGPSPKSRDVALAWTDRLSPVRIGITADDVVKVDFLEDSCLEGTALVLATDAEDRSKSLLIHCDNCCPKPKRGIETTAEPPPHLEERVDPQSQRGRRPACEAAEARTHDT